jgi:hypothetical protein
MNARIAGATLIALLVPRSVQACAPFIFIPHEIHSAERAIDRRRPHPPTAQLSTISRAEPEVTINGGVMKVNT